MINQRINCCLTFSQGKCPHLTMMKRICLFPQILNIIDTELAKTNCLDCNKYIDRRVLSTESTLEGKMLQERRTTMASEIEKRQYPRARIRWPVSITSSQVLLRGVTRDISPGGLSIHLEKQLEASIPITISTTIATRGDTLELTGEVVWSNSHSFDNEITLPSIGVQFIAISYKRKRTIGLAVFNQLIAEGRKPANFANLRALVVWGLRDIKMKDQALLPV
jgi:hypothetical protein